MRGSSQPLVLQNAELLCTWVKSEITQYIVQRRKLALTRYGGSNASRSAIPYASSHFYFLAVARTGEMFGFHCKTNISTDSTSLTGRQLESLDKEIEINICFIFQLSAKYISTGTQILLTFCFTVRASCVCKPSYIIE